MILPIRRNLIFYFWLACSIGYSQSNKVDSLLLALETTDADSSKCGIYYELLVDLIYDDPIKGVKYGKEYLEISKNVGVREKVSANNQLGIAYYNLGQLNKTLEHFSVSIDLLDSIGDLARKARMLNNLSIIYDELGQNDKALEYSVQSLYARVKIDTDTSLLSNIFGNVGLDYLSQNQLDSANKYISLGYKIDKKNGDSVEIMYSSSNMAQYHQVNKNYDSAEYYFNTVEEIAISLGGQSNELCGNYNLKGKLYLEIERNQKAYENFYQAYLLAKKLRMSMILVDSYNGLAESLQKLGRNEEANGYLRKYINLKDSIFTAETNRQLESAEIQQKEQEITLLTQQGEIDTLRIKQSRYLLYFLIGVVFFVVVIAIIYYQKHEYKVRTFNVLEQQRNEIAEKNKNILDSMAYAKGIQEAMFPNEEELKGVFKESFVYYKPSDVVTGDFYWISRSNHSVILAVVDCTGHGVPGAFMTVMANSMLNHIVNENGITSPSEILKELHASILNTWHSDEESALYSNGLDAAICNISFEDMKMTYSGAKRPLYHAREGKLNTYKGNCFSVGVPYYHSEISYDEEVIDILNGDFIYLFTDGIVDQFGGDENKKFLGKRLRTLVDEISVESAEVQQKKVDTTMQKWMSANEQVDDMLLVGVKI